IVLCDGLALCRGSRLLFLIVLSLVGGGIVYEYWTLTRLVEISPTVIATEATTLEKTKREKPHFALNTGRMLPLDSQLVDFPNCRSKWEWMKEGWKTDACYAHMGVNGTGCSFRRYLSITERHCPLMDGGNPWRERLSLNPNFSLDQLFAKMVDKPVNFEFMKKRISRMWDSWKDHTRRM
ncbi:hypothetical protein PENTCL1PPCAC_30494, partial [Pristionchus entomophagus]